MAWSSVYTAGGADNNETSTFMLYFMDTYLSGKAAWTVSAHPGGNASKRSVKITLPNIWEGGTPTSIHWWMEFTGSITTGSTYEWQWYADRTYTSVPGDLGTYSVTGFALPGTWGITTGSWRIWESDIDTQAILVTKGKRVVFYWPGSEQWAAKRDLTWDGSAYDESCYIGPYIGQSNSTLMHCGYPSSSTTAAEEIVPDMGGLSSLSGYNAANDPALVAGVSFLSCSSSAAPSTSAQPVLPRTGADTLVWMPGSASVTSSRFITTPSTGPCMVMYNTLTSKYYLMGGQDLTSRFMAWDMGTTEPDFS